MRVCLLLLVLSLPCTLLAQSNSIDHVVAADSGGTSAQATTTASSVPASTPSQDKPRWYFPKHDWIYGYGEFDLAPPHNELDPNLCLANSGDFGGTNSTCTAFARWVISGQVEIRPFGVNYLRRLKLFAAPTFVFGRNVPQTLYTWSMDPIGWERQWGASVYMGKRFEFRATQHFLFGRFNGASGPAYIGPNGPWGRYFMIGVRKYFGYASVHDDGGVPVR
jgi:hypothetical protein